MPGISSQTLVLVQAHHWSSSSTTQPMGCTWSYTPPLEESCSLRHRCLHHQSPCNVFSTCIVYLWQHKDIPQKGISLLPSMNTLTPICSGKINIFTVIFTKTLKKKIKEIKRTQALTTLLRRTTQLSCSIALTITEKLVLIAWKRAHGQKNPKIKIKPQIQKCSSKTKRNLKKMELEQPSNTTPGFQQGHWQSLRKPFLNTVTLH